MSAIKNKLKSRRGASITFALLLFLVCAVISSVVIVAATASAGRVSGVKETDQRYYAAIEAAKRLQTIFDKKQVEVTYDRSTKSRDTATITVPADGNYTLLKNISFCAATGTAYEGGAVTITNGGAADYTCTVTPKLEGGLLTFSISVTGGTENINTGTYALDIVFASNVKRPDPGSGATKAKATVSWKLHSLKKGRATISDG